MSSSPRPVRDSREVLGDITEQILGAQEIDRRTAQLRRSISWAPRICSVMSPRTSRESRTGRVLELMVVTSLGSDRSGQDGAGHQVAPGCWRASTCISVRM